MTFFVDTADTAEIKSLAAGGVIDGVTATRSLVTGPGKEFTDDIREIYAADVAAAGYDGMMHEAAAPREIANNVADHGLAGVLADWRKTGRTIA